jgi:Na+-transporting NADH:ubiquinone oxidoreductase subunit C
VPDSRDSIRNTFIVAIGVSLVCSILVSAAAVLLKPQQELNETRYRQRIVLEVAGLYSPDVDIAAQFAAIDARTVELASGNYVDIPASDAETSDQYAEIYLVREGDVIEQIILPVYGAGLWSTMYGYLAVEPDGRTVRGLRFYEHAETPGLGDQIEKPDWLAQWPGKQLYDGNGNVRIEVVRGQAPPGPDEMYQVDGMSGATLTGRGVSNLLQRWVGPQGFGPYLAKFSTKVAAHE